MDRARMPRIAPQRLPVIHGVVLALVCWGGLALLSSLGALEAIDLKLSDWRYRLRGSLPATSRLALVEVDDPTIAAYGSWPLPRETYALLIAALQEARAQAIGLDLLFLGNSPDDPTADRLLARVTRGQSNLVHAMSFLPGDPSLAAGAAPAGEAKLALVRHGRPFKGRTAALAQRVSLPYDELLEAADALGHTAVAVDPDGVVRRIPLFVRYGERVYPSLAIRLVESAARNDASLPRFQLASDGLHVHRRGSGRSRVPHDAEGATAIVFAGDRSSFPQSYSMLQVLQWYRDGHLTPLRRAFEGKLVLVGATAVGEIATDVGAMPFASAAPLVYIHANAVHAAITARFMRRPPAWILLLASAGLGGALGWLFAVLPLAASIAAVSGGTVAIGGLDYLLFARGNLDIPPTAALLLPPLVWTAVEGYRRVATEREARIREHELQVARTIQRRLLPERPPEMPEFDVFGTNLPAEAVGGDYYDWLPLGSDGLAVVVGDVTGHGVPAALLMSHLRASFHAEARTDIAPRIIVGAVHASLIRAVEPGRFATFFLAVLSRSGSTLRFCNAGHNPPLFAREGRIETFDATGPPLAAFEDASWTDEEREFRRGDVIVLYSDGIPECPWKQELYEMERLQAVVSRLATPGRSAKEIGEAVLTDVRTFAHGHLHTDDVTLVVVRRV